MNEIKFRGVHDRGPAKGRGFVSAIQKAYLTATNPDLAANMARYTDPTASLPMRAEARKRRK